MTSKLRHLDLCSGIGGFSLGLEATGGVKTVAFCEREAYPQAILKQHWPDVPCYKDVKELTYDQLQADGLIPIDLLTAGYPCQPFSIAGKQRGTDDPRHLWPDIFRLVKECQPAVVLFENVEGHIRLGLDEVWSDLENEGYAVRTFNIPAAGVGAPHRRNRLWIVGFNLAFTDSQRLRGAMQGCVKDIDGLPEGQLNNRNNLWSKTAGRGDLRSAAVANSDAGYNAKNGEVCPRGDPADTSRKNVAHADNKRQQQPQEDLAAQRETARRGWLKDRGLESQHAPHQETPVDQFWETDPSTFESRVGRMAYGIPKRVDRVKALGNAIVPQIAYLLGVALLNTLREIPK